MNYICDTKNITYDLGYIALRIPDFDLPDSIEIKNEILVRKSEFHVSLLHVKGILKNSNMSEEMILEIFCQFLQKNTVTFSAFSGEFRFANDPKRGRKSLVAMCSVNGLENFASFLSKKLNCKIAVQPTHVTLYTLQLNAGIGINTPEDLKTNTEIIDVPFELKKVFKI